MRVTTFFAGAAAAAAFAFATPAAAQFFPGYGNPYGYGTNPYGYAPNPYGYGVNRQAVVAQCANAVQARLNGGYGGYGGYGDQYGYGDGGYGRGRVLGISRVEPGYGGGMTVRGVATTGRMGGYGYTPNSPVDLVWRCRTDFRGAIVDLDVDPARPNYDNYNYTPWSQDYSQYGYYRY